MAPVAVVIAVVSSAMAFAIAMLSFGTLGVDFGLDTSTQLREALIIALLTLVTSFLFVISVGRRLQAPQSIGMRFVQGAFAGLIVFIVVVLGYAALNYEPGSTFKSVAMFADITLRFGGWAIPLVSGALSIGLEFVRRTVAQQTVQADVPASRARRLTWC